MTSRALSHRERRRRATVGDRPVERARLLERGTVEAALAAIRARQPYDGDAWLDHVGDVLDSVPQAEDRMDKLAQRLRGYLLQLVGYPANSGAEAKDQRAVKATP